MIIRTSERDRYVIISKVPLEDTRLSWKARGLLAYLLSKPDNWRVIVAHLVSQGPDQRLSVMRGLQELERAGYLVRQNRRKSETGQYDGVDSMVFEEPTAVRLSASGKSTTSEYLKRKKNEMHRSIENRAQETVL